jgi:uncharacterized membrane protein
MTFLKQFLIGFIIGYVLRKSWDKMKKIIIQLHKEFEKGVHPFDPFLFYWFIPLILILLYLTYGGNK